MLLCSALWQLFACPSSRDHLLALPDLVDHARARAFRAEQPGSWLLYQHLRKAGTAAELS